MCSRRWILSERSVLSSLNNFWIQSLWQAGSHSHKSVDNLLFMLVLSSFGLNRLGRSKQSYEHHPACHCAEPLDVGGLFNRRNPSPLSDWQVVELLLCLWMKLKVKLCNLFHLSFFRSTLIKEERLKMCIVAQTYSIKSNYRNFQSFQRSKLHTEVFLTGVHRVSSPLPNL